MHVLFRTYYRYVTYLLQTDIIIISATMIEVNIGCVNPFNIRTYEKRTVTLNEKSLMQQFFLWTRRESNPRPKAHSLYFYYHSLLLWLTPFPPVSGNRQPDTFSSFIIRPCTQSLMHVVSHIVDARILRCECPRADSCH